MISYHVITSDSSGIVEKVLVNEGDYAYEWEPLFVIKSKNGASEKVELGVSGKIDSIEVQPGEEISIERTLAVIEGDNLPSGCD